MSRVLRRELKQTKPFRSTQAEAYLNVLRTAEYLSRAVEQHLKTFGLTGTQYNVLRILRGAGERGLTCGEIAGRMITHVPDVTRLLDRLEAKGWLARTRDNPDRRVVVTRITPEGRALADRLDAPVLAMHARLLAHLNGRELKELIRELEKVRAKPDTTPHETAQDD
jgi:DNA-binding MarR family transcriptional regulator